MNNVLKAGKRALSVTVAVTTMVSVLGLSSLVASFASAATITSGDLIKGSLKTVYYYGADGKRYPFLTEKTYKTWYNDFSTVKTITDAELSAIPLRWGADGNVTYRPGVRMMKINTAPTVYAVSKHAVLRPVASEAVAVALYGSNWNKMIDDVEDAVMNANYTLGAEISAASQYSVSGEMAAAPTINADKGLASGGEVVVPVTGALSASLNPATPASQSVPNNASGVNFVKFDLRNTSGAAVTVNGVTLKRFGNGVPADFAASGMVLYDGDARLSTGRSVNSTSHEVLFSALNLSIAAGQTKTLWLSAEMTGTAGNEDGFSVIAVDAGSTVVSGLPVSGNVMRITASTVGTMTAAKAGSVSSPNAGQLSAKVSEFSLNAATEDIEVRRVTLTQSGTIARSNLSNFVLKYNGNPVATVASLNSKDQAVFTLAAPVLIEKGFTRNFELFADVSGSARGGTDTIEFYMDEASDLYAVGRTYNYGVAVTNNFNSALANHYQLTVQGSQVTVTMNGPASRDIATNSKDVEVLNFTIASQSNIEVRRLVLKVSGFTSADVAQALGTTYFTDVKLSEVVSGGSTVVSSSNDVTGNATTEKEVFTDIISIAAGKSKTFKVTMDVASNVGAVGKIRVDLMPLDSSTDVGVQSGIVKNIDNNTSITTGIVPASTLTGNKMSLKAPGLSMGAASTPVSQTYVVGAQGVDVGSFTFKAGSSSDVKITSISLTCFVDAANANMGAEGFGSDGTARCEDILSSVKLMNGTQMVAGSSEKSPTASGGVANTGGELEFNNLNLTVPAGQPISLRAVANLNSNVATAPDYIRLKITSDAKVASQDMDGNSLTETDLNGGAFGAADAVGNVMTVSTGGTLTYALAPTDADTEAGIVVAGNNVVLAKYRFVASNEDMKLTKVRMKLLRAAAVNNVSGMSLYDGTKLLASAPVDSNGNADFTNFAFEVPKGSKTLTIKAQLNTVANGATSGENIAVVLCDGGNNGSCASDTDTFEARGMSQGSSTVDMIGDSGDVSGNTKIVRKTMPKVTLATLPTTTFTNGVLSVMRFTVAADSAENVSMNSMIFNVVPSDVGGAAIAVSATSSGVREVGQANVVPATVTVKDAAGTACTSADAYCLVRVAFTSEEIVPAGGSKTYDLRLNVTAGADTAGESLSVSFANSNGVADSALVTGELEAGTGNLLARIDENTDFDGDGATQAAGDEYNFIWSDNSSADHSYAAGGNVGADDATGDDWTNGTYVKGLPSDPQVMTR